jgi:hypothetical protein
VEYIYPYLPLQSQVMSKRSSILALGFGAFGLVACSSGTGDGVMSSNGPIGSGDGSADGNGGGSSGTSNDNAASGGEATRDADTFGEAHTGQYHLGPVDFAETEWHNACAPAGGYKSELRAAAGLSGEYIAGVSNEYSEGGGVCDACILIETATGNSIVARVVTYGVEQEAGDIDVSPSVFDTITTGEYPRTMTWHFARCPETGGLSFEFQTEANIYWTSLWVRSPRVPLSKVEVQSTNHESFTELERGTDGTLTDPGGFGDGAFTLRMTGIDGQVLTEEFPGFTPGEVVASTQQFD